MIPKTLQPQEHVVSVVRRKLLRLFLQMRYWLKNRLFRERRVDDMLLVQSWWMPILVDEQDADISAHLRDDGVYDVYMSLLLRRTISKQDIAVNIGANVGYVPLLCERAQSVHAFEPDPRSYRCLAANAKRSDNIIPHRMCIGDHDGDVQFCLAKEVFGNSSLYEQNLKEQSKCESVPMRTLDSMVDQATVIVMDIQGAEFQAIRGMPRLLATRPLIVMEFWPFGLENAGEDPHEVVDLLKGYSFYNTRMVALTFDYIMQKTRGTKEGRGFMNLVCVPNGRSGE